MIKNAIQRTFTREAKEIARLYTCLQRDLVTIGERACKIGELLSRVKEGLPHGQFEDWVSETLTFGPRQARRYMEFHVKVVGLNNPTKALLAEEWKELCNPKPKQNGSTTSDLPPTEIEDLKRTEGAVEPEEREQEASGDEQSEPAVEAAEAPAETRLSDVPRDADGVAIPEDLRGIFATQEQFETFANKLSYLHGELAAAVEANPEAWAVADPQKRLSELHYMAWQVKEARPYLICPTCGGEDPNKRCRDCDGRRWLSRYRARSIPIDSRNLQRKRNGLDLLTRPSQRAGEETK